MVQASPGVCLQAHLLTNTIEFASGMHTAGSDATKESASATQVSIKPCAPPRLACSYQFGTTATQRQNENMARSEIGRLSCLMCPKPVKAFLIVMAFFAVAGAWASSGSLPATTNLTADQIVARMQTHDRIQQQELQHYQSVRVYRVEYRGYSARIAARMKVLFSYDATTGKSFRILSRSGSSFLCDDVLKRAVESEEQASRQKGSTALTSANYSFRLLGTDQVNGRPAYILDVTPLKPEKFLYKGKIWVDATDFALVKIEATPAKNPSFWISRTAIWYSNAITDGFWLPQETKSKTSVRIGGTAVLTIDYGPYQIPPSAMSSTTTEQSAAHLAPVPVAPARQIPPPAETANDSPVSAVSAR